MSAKGIYHNGITAQPFSCDLALQDGSLYLYLGDANKSLVIWSLQHLDSVHLNGSSLIVKNGSYPHETLECSGEIARLIYAAWSKNSVVRTAEGFVFKRKYLSALILCTIFLGFCGLGYFFVLPWVAQRAVDIVPVSLEIEMGEQLSKTLATGETINDSATYFANRFIQHLQLHTEYPLQIHVVQSAEINAFALPGGNIVIYSGILAKMSSYEELVALIGHEVTHVTNRHSLRSISRSIASGLLIATLFGDVTGISAAVLDQADQFKQLDYSRDLETEADNNGLQLMTANRVSPRGMLQLLELLKAESAQMPALMKYLSTHPETDARIANIAANPGVTASFAANPELERIFKDLKRTLKP